MKSAILLFGLLILAAFVNESHAQAKLVQVSCVQQSTDGDKYTLVRISVDAPGPVRGPVVVKIKCLIEHGRSKDSGYGIDFGESEVTGLQSGGTQRVVMEVGKGKTIFSETRRTMVGYRATLLVDGKEIDVKIWEDKAAAARINKFRKDWGEVGNWWKE